MKIRFTVAGHVANGRRTVKGETTCVGSRRHRQAKTMHTTLGGYRKER